MVRGEVGHEAFLAGRVGLSLGGFPEAMNSLSSTEQGQAGSFNCSDFHISASADESQSPISARQGRSRCSEGRSPTRTLPLLL